MSVHIITHTCGHEVRYSFDGTHKKNDWREKRLLAEDCYDCRVKKERAADLDAAIKKSGDLPILQGTEKQIAWAMTIRSKAIDYMEAGNFGLDIYEDGLIPAALKEARKIDSAKWWIDHRDQDIIDELLKSAGLMDARGNLIPKSKNPA